MDIKGARAFAKRKLYNAKVPDPVTDADLIVMETASLSREELFFSADVELSKEQEERLFSLVKERCKRIPLQLLLGTAPFYGRDFLVDGNVLVPRPETEILVEEALKLCGSKSRMLDIFTGSGCIAISIFLEKEGKAEVYAGDISEDALKVAKKNADILGANDIRFVQGDVFFSLQNERRFDIITANPPYIRDKDIDDLEPEVRLYDPRIALSGGEDGLFFYRRISEGLAGHLCEGGYLLTEIGWDQKEDVSRIFSGAGFTVIKTVKDYSGHDRVMIIRG